MITKQGQSLIELLIAIGLTAILLPALLTALVASSEGRAQSQQRTEATNLLKEAEEAARTIRESGWQQISSNGTFHPFISGSNWILVAGPESINGYTRKIEIQDAQRDASGNIAATGTQDPSTKKITTTVSWTTPINSQVDSTQYFSRYLSNANIQETTQAQFSLGTHTNTQTVNNSGGEVELTRSASSSDYGNKFRLTAVSSIGNMTSINHKTSLRFTAQNSKTVSAIRVYLQTESGTSPSYRFGIQANSGTVPSGIFLGSGAQTNTSTGWKTIGLSPSVNLTAGSIYHLVIEPVGTPTTSANIALRRSTPLNNLYPQTQAIDSQANTLFKTSSAGAWIVQNFQPIYELDFTDGTFEGNSYQASTEVSIFGNNWIGEKFTVSAPTGTANSVSFCIRKIGTPGGSLTVELRDSTNTTIYSGELTTVAAAPTAYTCPGSWQTHTFPVPITLASTTTYRIILRTTGGNNSNSYRLHRLDATNTSNYNSITYDGTNSVYTISTNAGNTWTDTNSSDVSGLFFNVTTASGYSTSGTFQSQTKDAGSNVAFNNIKWVAATPAGTALQFQVATSSSPSGPWDFFGSDGAIGSYFTGPDPIPLNRLNGRYLRYNVLFVSDGVSTPTLSEINFNYSP